MSISLHSITARAAYINDEEFRADVHGPPGSEKFFLWKLAGQ